MIEKASSLVTYSGAGTAVYFGLSPGEWQVIGIVGGLIFAAAGYFTTLYFKRQHLKIARAAARSGGDE